MGTDRDVPSVFALIAKTRENLLVYSDGRVENLGHIGQADMLPGDVFEIHSQGVGGFGES